MTPLKLAPVALALSLAAAIASAQTDPASAPPAIDGGSIQALKDMGVYLQTLDRFRVSTELTGERVLADGQKLQHMAYAVVDAERPDKLRAHMTSARSAREIIYNGQTATISLPTQKYYSTVEFSGPLATFIGKLEERYGVEIPLADLFTWGTPAAPIERIDSAMNAGQDYVDDELCDHYAFRQGRFDWQIWISAEGRPLPRKLVIINRADEARPQSVSILHWDLKPKFTRTTFDFKPPKGSQAVELHALDEK
ncbi:MAG: DUF2092 domain-containing protein [Propionivibrio sp.]